MELPPMPQPPPACRRHCVAVARLIVVGFLVVLCGPLGFGRLAFTPSALAATTPGPQSYRCDGDPLLALLINGPMDDPSIPDPSTGSVPIGGAVVLQWRQNNLQLPRTNNAGPVSFTDGIWWWSLEDPSHPSFRHRRGPGDVQDVACEPL
jgi:hypothetical protein